MVKPDRLQSRHFRASRHLSVAGIGLLVIIVTTAGSAIWDRRVEAIAGARQEMAILGAVLAEQTARSVQAIEIVLQQTLAMVLAVSVHPLHDVPLVVTVSMAEDAVLANWRRQSLLIALGTLCTVIGFALLFRALVADSRSLERSEAKLRESEARCRDFAMTLSDWFWEADENHRFTYLSDHIRAFSQDPQTCIGRTRRDLATDVVIESAKWQDHLALLDRHEPFRDFVYRRKIGDDRERVISVSGNPLLDNAGRFLGYRGTARDVTEKVLAERAVQRAAAEAANSARSQFLTNVSRKLRTPLDAILGFSEVLENGTAGPLQSRQAEYVGLIRESSDHLSRVISEMLDLARIDAGNLDLNEEVLEPGELVDSAIALVRDRAAAGLLKLAVDIEEHMAPLLADRTRLMEILLTLLASAIELTELGGMIDVLVRRTEEGGAAFVVRDNGSGMTEADIEIALGRFDPVDGGLVRRHGGSGLGGLPLVRGLAELHGGSLTLKSERGRGTTATVVLPPSRVLAAESAAVGPGDHCKIRLEYPLDSGSEGDQRTGFEEGPRVPFDECCAAPWRRPGIESPRAQADRNGNIGMPGKTALTA